MSKDDVHPHAQAANTISLRETSLILTCALLFSLEVLGVKGIALIGLLFFTALLIRGHIRRLGETGYSLVLRWLGYYAPYILFVFTLGAANGLLHGNAFLSLVSGLMIGGAYFAATCYAYRDYLSSRDMLLLTFPYEHTKENAYWVICSLMGAVVSEELFYRLLIFNLINDGLIALVVSTLLFVASHHLSPWSGGRYTPRDYLMQFIIGLICGIVFLLTGSLFGAILIHLSHNLLRIVTAVVVLNSLSEANDTNAET